MSWLELTPVPACWQPAFVSAQTQDELWAEWEQWPWVRHRVGRAKLARATTVLTTHEVSDPVLPVYWGEQVHVQRFGPHTERLRQRVVAACHTEFNVCLVNFYRDGRDTISWHSDREELGPTRCIASVSLGATRTFQFKEKGSGQETEVQLCAGSLLVMHAPCQETHLHRVPKEPEVLRPRLNFTFRQYGPDTSAKKHTK